MSTPEVSTTGRLLAIAKTAGSLGDRMTALESRMNNENAAIAQARQAQDALIVALNAALEALRLTKGKE